MFITSKQISYRITRRAGEQGVRPSVGNEAGVEKYATSCRNGNLLKCKKTFLIATLNTRSLNNNARLGEVTALAEQYKIDIVCIQEHKIFHEDAPIAYKELGKGWILVTSKAEKASNNATIRGVGMLLSPQAYKCLNNVESITPRIMTANFNGNPKVTVISCYSPTNTSEEEVVTQFYGELSNLVKAVPKHNIKIIGGDMNAKLGRSDVNRLTYGESTNRNGKMLTDFMRECDFIAMNTRFQKRKGKLWTFEYPNGEKAQLDFVMINKKWRNSALNCEAYSTFLTVGSDHRVVTAKIRLSLRASKTTNKKVRYNWSMLLEDNNVMKRYNLEVSNKFQLLMEKEESDSANNVYRNIVIAHQESSELHIPKKVRIKKDVPWESTEVIEKREALRKAQKAENSKRTRASVKRLEEAKKELEECYVKAQEKYIEKKVEEIENAIECKQSKVAWNTVNEISGRKTSNKGKLKADNPAERVKLWKDHFVNLLGQPPVITDNQSISKVVEGIVPISTEEFNLEELRKCIKSFKNNKAVGVDNIPIEVWKSGALELPLLNVCNKALNGERPDMWVKSNIIPLPKKGDLGQAKNYRGITLTVTASKIYNKMLLFRIRPQLEPILRINQNGFRPGRSTLSQILVLRRLIEGIKAKQLTAVITFVDFKKAFDSIHRGKLMEILSAYGIPDKIVVAINILYTDTTAQVISPDGDTNFFQIHAGVLQGDTLAPFLFIIALDYALRQATKNPSETGFTIEPSRSSRYPANIETDTDFADDIALFSDNLEKAQLLLERVEAAAQDIGLHVNEGKTKYMRYNLPQGDIWAMSGTALEEVDNFLYLGAWVDDTEKDIEVRIAKGWSALNRMEIIWKSKIQKELKIRFFRATVESVMMYGAESWTLTKTLEKRLDGVYTRMLRTALDIPWKRHISNKELYRELPKLSNTLKVRRLRFIGHVWRKTDEIAQKLLLWEPTQGMRKPGRPRYTYVDQLRDDTGLENHHLKEKMQNRKEWRGYVQYVRALSST